MNPTLAALATTVLLATSDLLLRRLGASVGVGVVVVATNLALALAGWGVLKASGEALWPKRWRLTTAAAVCRMAAVIFSIMALRQLEISQYYMVLYLFPVWTTLGGAAFFREVPRKLQWTGLAVALLGCGIVFGRGGIAWNMGTLTALLCSFFLAGQLLFLRKLGDENVFRVSWINALVGILGGALLLPLERATSLAPLSWPMALMMGGLIVVNIAGPITSFYAAGRLKAFVYGMLCYLQIPLAVGGAWAFFGERLTPSVGWGLALLVAGSLASKIPERKSANA